MRRIITVHCETGYKPAPAAEHPSDAAHAMSFIHPSAHSDRDLCDERRSAIYLPDGLATKLLCVCDAAAVLESSEPNSPIHSDLEDLWSNVRASSVSSVDSVRAEEDIRRFAQRYGLGHCHSCSSLNLLGETPSEILYKDLLEAAFGNPSGRTAFENGGHSNSFQIEELFINVSPSVFKHPDGMLPQCVFLIVLTDFLQFDEAGRPAESSPEIVDSSPPPSRKTPRIYYNRPHTPQVIYVNLSQQNYHDFWEIPNLMQKPSLFPPTPRNIKDWIFWQRVYGRQ